MQTAAKPTAPTDSTASPFGLYAVVAVAFLAVVGLVFYLAYSLEQGFSLLESNAAQAVSGFATSLGVFASGIGSELDLIAASIESGTQQLATIIEVSADRIARNLEGAVTEVGSAVDAVFRAAVNHTMRFAQDVVNIFIQGIEMAASALGDFLKQFAIGVIQILSCIFLNSLLFPIIKFVFDVVRDAIVLIKWVVCYIRYNFATIAFNIDLSSYCIADICLPNIAVSIPLYTPPDCNSCPSLFPCAACTSSSPCNVSGGCLPTFPSCYLCSCVCGSAQCLP